MRQLPFLYLITPPGIDNVGHFTKQLEIALSAADGQVSAVQIRLKDTSDDGIIAIAHSLMPIIRAHGVMVILNDRVDLAARLGCDGVHLGQGDGSVSTARKALGAQAVIGVTCHNSKDFAIQAAQDGADYVAFGAFYTTTTKVVEHSAAPEILNWCHDMLTLPCVAIGGITARTAPDLLTAGADMIAVCGAVWDHPGGAGDAIRDFVKTCNAASVIQ